MLHRIKRQFFTLCLLLGCLQTITGKDYINGGLFFRSFEVDKDQRTRLELTPDGCLSFPRGFSMEFDINLRRAPQNFGYIFRIVGNDTLNIDLSYNFFAETNFSLVMGHQALLKFVNREMGFWTEKWVKISLHCNPLNDSITLSVNGLEKKVTCSFGKIKRFRVYFGGNAHPAFATTDVAPMTVKNIRFYDEKHELTRHWMLEKHADGCVYDECKSAKATVCDPVWMIDSHIKWANRMSYVLHGSHYSMTFDSTSDRIFIVKDKTVLIYNTRNNKTDTIAVQAGVPYNIWFNQLKYNPDKDELFSYSFNSDLLAKFSFTALAWSYDNPNAVLPQYMHHGSYFLVEDSLLVTFAGYGFHRYNSVLQKHGVKTGNRWNVTNFSSSIAPRYLGAMGYLGGKKLLYFGGFGNKSGRQEESPQNYYDLYSIHIDSLKVKKIWELPPPALHFTNSNSLIIDKDKGKFYALAYPNNQYSSMIVLHEYDLERPEYRSFGDSIPYLFNDVDSYCDLYQNSGRTELYAIASSAKDGISDINIYSMAYPPMSSADVLQRPPVSLPVWFWALLPALPVCGIIIFVISRKRKSILATQDDTSMEPHAVSPVVLEIPLPEKTPSSICLLGKFMIIDREGNDLTKNLTPITTQLFLILLIFTIKNGQGILSQELRKILWADKDDESARNNRNVCINKLRTSLKPFGEIKVVYHAEYWKIQYENGVFCDYERVLALIKTLQIKEYFDRRLLSELLDIALGGTLLPYIQQSEWLETYQLDYADMMIENLLDFSKIDEVKTDYALLLKLADVILLLDNIDENAIKLKCYALYRIGKKNHALQAFNKFTTDYETLLATKHHLVFEELVK